MCTGHPPFYVDWASNKEDGIGSSNSDAWKRDGNDRYYNKMNIGVLRTNSNYGHNDVISFKYDTKESKIYFKINDNEYDLLFDKIQKGETIKYKIGVGLSKHGDALSLIKFNAKFQKM